MKVLLLLNAGRSMDDRDRVCKELFSAACNEFKSLEYFYYRSMVYKGLWKDSCCRCTRKMVPLHQEDGNASGAAYL